MVNIESQNPGHRSRLSLLASFWKLLAVALQGLLGM